MKLLSTIPIVALVVMATYTSCKTPAEKVDKAEEKVIEANQNLEIATNDYLVDIEKYKIETANKIAANDKSIADIKVKVLSQKEDVRDKYVKRIEKLERKNTDLKKRMDDYKASGKENWEHFKLEFKSDMDDLGKSFQNVFINNVDV
ncbi:MAG: hypothetical protein H7331_02030 [Bacteroidia bacterium]|nr:hypothetical protein [Bacteroidia bacterium]